MFATGLHELSGYIVFQIISTNSWLAVWSDTLVVRSIHRTQSALELGPSHCPNGRLGQDLGFGGFDFALKLPELLNTNLPTVRAKLGQTSCFPNGAQIWCPTGQ